MALGRIGDDESGEGGIFADINITPLTDIFLVLLIIFMITQSAIVESAAKVNLPKATQTQQESRGVTITLTADDRIFVNQLPTESGALLATLQDLLADDDRKLVILQGDEDALLGRVVALMDIARRAGALAISIAAEKRDVPPAAEGGTPGQ